MIKSVHLRSWRAYRELDLELGTGTTFIVAANGVGKSSLLEAVAWALYGSVANQRPTSAIAAGFESADVEVVLSTAVGDVRIRRSVNAKGATSLRAELPGDSGVLTEEDPYIRWLETTLSAKAKIAARLTMLSDHGALSENAGEFPVKDHLAATFGVTELLAGASQAEAVRKQTERERKKLRTAVNSATKQMDATKEELAVVDEEVRIAKERHSDAVAAAADADRAKFSAAQWVTYRQRVVQREGELGQITSSLHGVTRSTEGPGELIKAQASLTRREVSESRDRAASASARAETTKSALDVLTTGNGVCPTCLRPLDETDTTAARSEHEAHHQALLDEASEAKRQLGELEGQLSDLDALARRLSELGPAPEPPTGPERELGEASAAALDASQIVTAAFAHLQQLQALRQPLATAIANKDEQAKMTFQQVTAFRKEALAEAARDTLQNLADNVMANSIIPLTVDVANRWKLLFGSAGGLRLGVDGAISMEINGRTLDFQDLSGGERVSAMLVTRLLVLSASTSARFAWLDEPLERLDPVRRHTLAATLAKAAESDAFDQMIITTYDEQLARQLAASRPSVHIEHVRTSTPS